MIRVMAAERHDLNRIKRLNTITSLKTFNDDVKYFTRLVTSEHALERWEILSNIRWMELYTGIENITYKFDYVDGKYITRFFIPGGTEVFPQAN